MTCPRKVQQRGASECSGATVCCGIMLALVVLAAVVGPAVGPDPCCLRVSPYHIQALAQRMAQRFHALEFRAQDLRNVFAAFQGVHGNVSTRLRFLETEHAQLHALVLRMDSRVQVLEAERRIEEYRQRLLLDNAWYDSQRHRRLAEHHSSSPRGFPRSAEPLSEGDSVYQAENNTSDSQKPQLETSNISQVEIGTKTLHNISEISSDIVSQTSDTVLLKADSSVTEIGGITSEPLPRANDTLLLQIQNQTSDLPLQLLLSVPPVTDDNYFENVSEPRSAVVKLMSDVSLSQLNTSEHIPKGLDIASTAYSHNASVSLSNTTVDRMVQGNSSQHDMGPLPVANATGVWPEATQHVHSDSAMDAEPAGECCGQNATASNETAVPTPAMMLADADLSDAELHEALRDLDRLLATERRDAAAPEQDPEKALLKRALALALDALDRTSDACFQLVNVTTGAFEDLAAEL